MRRLLSRIFRRHKRGGKFTPIKADDGSEWLVMIRRVEEDNE